MFAAMKLFQTKEGISFYRQTLLQVELTLFSTVFGRHAGYLLIGGGVAEVI